MKIPMAWGLCMTMMLSACSNARPVLYENDRLKTVGKEAAEQDIESCKEAAESAAAEEGSGLTQDHIERAIRMEFREIGKLADSGVLE